MKTKTAGLITCNVAGVTFEGRQKILRKLARPEGGIVRNFFDHADAKLRRDPGNEHDPNAIKVLVKGKHVGYVPKSVAETLGPKMDNGKRAKVVRLDIDVYDGTWHGKLVIKADL